MMERLSQLFRLYYTRQATAEQRAELMQLIESASPELLGELIVECGENLEGTEHRISPDQSERILNTILQPQVAVVKKMTSWRRIAVAASLIFLVGLGIYFIAFRNSRGTTETAQKQSVSHDLPPGHDGAILTLADGRSIVLDNAQNGKITDVAVKKGNQVSYEKGTKAPVEYNTMTTPKGRQYSLVLSDGTQVWLNAASSITYPTAFVGKDRRVEITGEAYFEVAHDATKPFHVKVNTMEVQVLGTHFNINSYPDEEAIKTTLLQGSIKISVAGKTQMVKPGQQTQVRGGSEIKMVNDADVDQVMAWKNGLFQFNDAPLTEVLRQIQRWYDVEVVYQAGIPEKIFEGKISRQSNLSQVLKILGESGIHFEIMGRKLIVKP